VRERDGSPFRQIFWSRNGAPANIVGHRWNATGNTEAFRQITSYSLGWPSISLFSGPNCPQTRDLASKISPNPISRRGDPLPHPSPARLHAVRGGASSPVAGTYRSRKPFPQIKTTPLHPCQKPPLISPYVPRRLKGWVQPDCCLYPVRRTVVEKRAVCRAHFACEVRQNFTTTMTTLWPSVDVLRRSARAAAVSDLFAVRRSPTLAVQTTAQRP